MGRAWRYEPSPDAPLPPAGLPAGFARGDFLVGSRGPGAAPADALRRAGAAAIIATTFAEGFVRAAIAVGLPALVVEETDAIKTGDRLRVDPEVHVIANLSSGDRYVIRNITAEELDVLRAGGLAAYRALAERLRRG